MEKIINTII